MCYRCNGSGTVRIGNDIASIYTECKCITDQSEKICRFQASPGDRIFYRSEFREVESVEEGYLTVNDPSIGKIYQFSLQRKNQ